MSTTTRRKCYSLLVGAASLACVADISSGVQSFVGPGAAPTRLSARPVNVRASEQPAGRSWEINSSETLPSSGSYSILLTAFCILCAGTAAVQPAEARPFVPSKFYQTEKRDNKGLLHAMTQKVYQKEKLPIMGQFLKDDSKRVELAAKRNGAVFSTLNMDADKAEKLKAALMSIGLLGGMVIANPGNAFPRPGPMK